MNKTEILILKCESKFQMAGEDSSEAEFTTAQKSSEARALVARRRGRQMFQLHWSTKG